MDETHRDNGQDLRALDLFDALTAIKGRAQVTRRRVLRVDQLDRDHIAADLGEIADQVSRMAALLRHIPAGSDAADAPAPIGERLPGHRDATDRFPAGR